MLAVVCLLAASLTWAGGRREILKFAAEMAANGNWREAHFRWSGVVRSEPDDARWLNNLAVASEALGEVDEAQRLYERAREIDPRDPIIRDNASRALRFRARTQGERLDPVAARAAAGSDRVKPGRRGERVQILLPVPPRLDLGERRRLLVASFLTGDDEVMDSNREIVRFLRGEFRRRTPLDAIDVTPAPAIPEQTLDDLAANAEFWKFLGRRHDADVIVSGRVEYDRKDVSGFRDVDVVSPDTGQKVRTSRFTEAEEFRFVVHVLFLDGRTGELLHRDTVSRGVIFTGLNNDPLTAFFELSEGLAEDVLAVIAPRKRADTRIIYTG